MQGGQQEPNVGPRISSQQQGPRMQVQDVVRQMPYRNERVTVQARPNFVC